MKKAKYTAGSVSKGFWFLEFKKYVEFLNSGLNKKEIREMQIKDNVLLAPSESYGMKMIGEVTRRAEALPDSIISMFFDLDVSNQKLVTALSIMLIDRLFFEFVNEVYREEIIKNSKIYSDSSFRIFMKNKSEQVEQVAKYTDGTKRRLAGAYKTYLREAGLLLVIEGEDLFQRVLIDERLEEILKSPELINYYKALTGEI